MVSWCDLFQKGREMIILLLMMMNKKGLNVVNLGWDINYQYQKRDMMIVYLGSI